MRSRHYVTSGLLIIAVAWSVTGGLRAGDTSVTALRTPNDGIQPQAVVDGDTVHLIYFSGDPQAGDVYYVRSRDWGGTWSTPVRVNSTPGAAIAMGNVRGAHLAIGRDGRAHVAWMGSNKTHAKSDPAPMLYARLNDRGDAFEAQRNVMTSTVGLDGGGSIAADDTGRVWVTWHGRPPNAQTEEANRTVWVARSTDDGQTFSPERPADPSPAGACGCCGMRAMAANGRLYLLYRTAEPSLERNIRLLVSTDGGERFRSSTLSSWKVGKCPMSTAAIVQGPKRTAVVAFESQDRVMYGVADDRGQVGRVIEPRTKRGPKHPVAVADAQGRVLMAWTEGMAWNRGGDVAWQVFDAEGRPVSGAEGRRDGVPAWSVITAFAAPDGRFFIVY
ncbi:MAG: hypothetical protein GC159_10475 [Phycisphaera sp.]|nr:hypothetical protein [Phycisphaera sp.]